MPMKGQREALTEHRQTGFEMILVTSPPSIVLHARPHLCPLAREEDFSSHAFGSSNDCPANPALDFSKDAGNVSVLSSEEQRQRLWRVRTVLRLNFGGCLQRLAAGKDGHATTPSAQSSPRSVRSGRIIPIFLSPRLSCADFSRHAAAWPASDFGRAAASAVREMIKTNFNFHLLSVRSGLR